MRRINRLGIGSDPFVGCPPGIPSYEERWSIALIFKHALPSPVLAGLLLCFSFSFSCFGPSVGVESANLRVERESHFNDLSCVKNRLSHAKIVAGAFEDFK